MGGELQDGPFTMTAAITAEDSRTVIKQQQTILKEKAATFHPQKEYWDHEAKPYLNVKAD